MKTKIDQLAEAALHRQSLEVRSLTQDLLREAMPFNEISRPETNDPRVLTIAAALIELLSSRHNQEAPAWTRAIGPMPEPFFLLEAATHMKRLRKLCEDESPEPLRKRRLYAPPNFLAFA